MAFSPLRVGTAGTDFEGTGRWLACRITHLSDQFEKVNLENKLVQKQNKTSIRTLHLLFHALLYPAQHTPAQLKASKKQKRISQVPIALESIESIVSVISGK